MRLQIKMTLLLTMINVHSSLVGFRSCRPSGIVGLADVTVNLKCAIMPTCFLFPDTLGTH
jgi:hypothetical protein